MEKGRTSSGLEIIQNCLVCPVRQEHLFCQLGPQALKELNSMRQTRVCSKGAVLFMEGERPRELFILCSGRAKLITSFRGHRSLIVRVADPGEVLGLSAVMSNAAHDVTAEAVELSQVSFIPQDDFLRFLQNHGEVSVRVAQQLSMELRDAHRQLARIALAPTVQARLAGLLLEWARNHPHPIEGGLCFQLGLTHEEIGELIGSSRETISRLLNEFRRKGLIQTKGTLITIQDTGRLEALLP